MNLIDEGQFGAPIILTPFNQTIRRRIHANYTAKELTAYLNLAAQSAKGSQINSSQFNFTREDRIRLLDASPVLDASPD